MRTLNRDFKLMCQRNRDGSFATQHDRERLLTMVANQLHEDGFKNLRAQGIRTKHIEHLVNRWQAEGASTGTMKNRMSALRWMAEKIGKENIVARDNAAYGIADRRFVTNESKAKELDQGKLDKVSDPYTAMSLRLQEAFGLRREESIKFQPGWADRGDMLVLKSTWTKGGKEREIPIIKETQRELLNQAKALADKGSLIPVEMSYIDQLNRFKAQTAFAGIDRVHGFRHAYAQARYAELTGWKAPAAGGPTSKQLGPEQKAIDRQARLTVSRELGHEREQITAVYIGR
ncbi:MAG: phage integrase N-terminal domain-containing protein [Aquabacterium sp.]|uniref:phage integrase N-terminal domain-containing protein n=1 Tax=Aquabacterium sp. TaxID=1872578 RepID=UPI003BAEA05C